MWGSNGDGILKLHPVEPHREGYGGDVLFWRFAEANGLDYGTKVMNGLVNQDNATPHTTEITHN
ncbi:hypothetical protein INT46_011412 [Mucor plumbeus]|uniref:Uncharacterized protein n=1 Tax=Mucor plumbeus TaxID=97098 RepID=A0A8H7RKI8_9FUNG|nr:hypothetical protein INT46_011412 [Mucor plumbeus]